MPKPLVIDLDGTLVRSDILIEAWFAYVKSAPLSFFRPLLWLATGGKSELKTQLAERIDLSVDRLPYDLKVIDWLRREKASGRQLVLATASHEKYAMAVSAHLGLFDTVIATDRHVNLAAENKRKALVARYGERGFDYAGNSAADLAVWRAAERAIVVNPEPGVERRARSEGNVGEVISSNHRPAASWLRALRLHQWLKNLLIFVPLLAAHKLSALPLLANGVTAFACFSLCASSVYLLNDLLDLDDDRRHARKRDRPFASGSVSIKAGLLAIPMLLALAFVMSALLLPAAFTALMALYFALTLAYSLAFKRVVVLDIVVLALLYTLRIVAGAAAFGLDLTFWMLAFSMFIFLSLALVKRHVELKEARARGQLENASGRGYHPDDLEMIASLGAASGYLSVLVLAMYIQDTATAQLYRYPHLIWLACPLLLFWVSRTWLLAHRGMMHEDPVVFAVTDRVSLIVGLLFGLVFWGAT